MVKKKSYLVSVYRLLYQIEQNMEQIIIVNMVTGESMN